MKMSHRVFASVAALVAAVVLTFPVFAQSADLARFLPPPTAGWASDDSGMSIPGQAMGSYYRENGDGDDASVIIMKQRAGANPTPDAAASALTGKGAKETPVEINGFRGKLTEYEGTLTLALPLGNHALVISTGTATRREHLIALARAVNTAALAKR